MTAAKVHKFVCLEPGVPGREGDNYCILGLHVKLLYPVLEAFCWTNLSPVDIDLLLLAGLVAYVDRDTKRTASWTRHFNLEIPVHEPDLWNSEEANRPLSEALHFATGDLWEFTFRPRKRRDDALQLPLKSLPEEESIILPYSGGLDSFTELKLSSFRYPNKKPILVTALHNKFLGGLIKATTDARLSSRLRVPVKLRPQRHNPEVSFRTRTFLFFVVAAVAAKLSQSNLVVVPENGQGGLGPSLVPCGIEHPLQSSHPGFTARLTQLLRAIWAGRSPSFIHPNLWKTKAQVISEAEALAGMAGWQETRSCSRSVFRHKRVSFRHCGICGGCLLRRQALFASSLSGKQEELYLWQHLEASNLKESLNRDSQELDIKITKLDELISAAAVIDHASLSKVAVASEGSPLRRAIREISESTGDSMEATKNGLIELLRSHRTEWMNFVDSLGPESWVANLGAIR